MPTVPTICASLNDQIRQRVGEGAYLSEIAKELGVSRYSLRRRLDRLGLQPQRPESRPPAPKRKTPPPASMGDDAELVAAFLKANKVTVLPTGWAAGLSQMEHHLHTAPAASGSLRERIHQHAQQAKRRRA